ncbi:nitrogen fixation protein NifZ [Desulfurobacterium atlanticum]|uniref:Nitrogen fixation protein NifZ n=1 Tax=Desulfurobacterium atlanticum TaxID=240169 RepID=A0A238YQK3_9BACT|nr:nitrogen fixation protein NifZ [Desulfurobacterium atlanticum]SNR72934.1 nitrogen fixation protein NifZ [Desulfurobacterium atlanticum]
MEKDPYDILSVLVGFSPGDAVKFLKDIKNDGTYPWMRRGDIIARKGDTGYIVRFLGYAPAFGDDLFEVIVEESGCIVVCRSCELGKVDVK